MDIRPINFIATVIGAFALFAWGIVSIKLSLTEGQRFVAVIVFIGLILLGGLYWAAIDWFRDQDKNERWLEESRKDTEARHERERWRLQEELLSTRKALSQAVQANAAPPTKEAPRARTKPKQ